jgi:NADH-quinone oxidoreductase subunit N
MFIGNLLALRQNSLKRLLACSSIAHLGYLLVPIIIGGLTGIRSAIFYLTAYFITTIGAFTVIAILSNKGKEIDSIDDFKGLYSKNKSLAIVLSVMMFSFAGIPLTAGFMSKFYILLIGVVNAQWLLLWLLIINSAIGLYYYLKVVFYILKPLPKIQNNKSVILPFGSAIVLSISLLIVIWIGVAPNGLLKIIYLFYK